MNRSWAPVFLWPSMQLTYMIMCFIGSVHNYECMSRCLWRRGGGKDRNVPVQHSAQSAGLSVVAGRCFCLSNNKPQIPTTAAQRSGSRSKALSTGTSNFSPLVCHRFYGGMPLSCQRLTSVPTAVSYGRFIETALLTGHLLKTGSHDSLCPTSDWVNGGSGDK